ncbi:unnamed protein product [Protopolystoma xenopodis]|uniref:Uncharacterized protein n=1 Tax=Protopolystoma xenopodis TaxID=117903 RepID=A0A448X7I1_9PLAT|nr:unnamed protein product [Protopolystoma xenopodis]
MGRLSRLLSCGWPARLGLRPFVCRRSVLDTDLRYNLRPSGRCLLHL